jgi:hypothetical protein
VAVGGGVGSLVTISLNGGGGGTTTGCSTFQSTLKKRCKEKNRE